MFKTRKVQVINCEFCAEGSSAGSLISVFQVSMEFNFLSIQVIENQQCL